MLMDVPNPNNDHESVFRLSTGVMRQNWTEGKADRLEVWYCMPQLFSAVGATTIVSQDLSGRPNPPVRVEVPRTPGATQRWSLSDWATESAQPVQQSLWTRSQSFCPCSSCCRSHMWGNPSTETEVKGAGTLDARNLNIAVN